MSTDQRTQKKLLGVCAWLADKFELDATLLRLIFVAAAILGVGSPILIYIILYFVMPGEYAR